MTSPFKLIKTDLEACKAVLVNLAEALRVVAILIKPFLPKTSETFYSAFNFDELAPGTRSATPTRSSRPAGPDLDVTAPLVRRQAAAPLPQDRHGGGRVDPMGVP